MNILFLVCGILIGAALTFIYFRIKTGGVTLINYNNLDRTIVLLEERDRLNYQEILRFRKDLQDERIKHSAELEQERNRSSKATIELAQIRENFLSSQQRLSEQRLEIDEMQKKFTVQFENIAGKLLEEKSQKFTEQNRTNMDVLLNPLKEKITAFEKKVEWNLETSLRNKKHGL